jgi:hypothetical protein
MIHRTVRKVVWLVVLTILKNMKVNGKDYPIPYIMENKKMFQSTNQLSVLWGFKLAQKKMSTGQFHPFGRLKHHCWLLP